MIDYKTGESVDASSAFIYVNLADNHLQSPFKTSPLMIGQTGVLLVPCTRAAESKSQATYCRYNVTVQ